MAKLDKIKLAELIGFLSCQYSINITRYDIIAIDNIIDIDVLNQQFDYNNLDYIERLMALMADGKQKIEAVKIYRAITGCGLKESKDAVERCWKYREY